MSGYDGDTAENIGFPSTHWVIDTSPIIAMVGLMVWIYTLPTAIKQRLVFQYGSPTLSSAYTAHFVHFSASHLLVNLIAFVLLAGVIYVLSVRAESRWLFFGFGATLLIAFPVLLSALNLAIPRNGFTYGFSGLNMVLVGFLPMVLATYVERELGYPVEGVVLLTAFFISIGYIAVFATPQTMRTNVIAIGAGTAALIFLLRAVLSLSDRLAISTLYVELFGESKMIAGVGVLIWGGLLASGFPETVAEGQAVTNIYIHFLGYAIGFITAYLAYEWQLVGDRSNTQPSPPSL